MTTAPKEFLKSVRNQYESLPYPYRDVEKELGVIYGAESHSLSALSHHGWQGKRDLREGARFLVMGHGTGDSLIFFAEQLRGHNAEIIGVDISKTSADIAKARLAKRALDNVTFCHASIFDLPSLDLGKFDVIECGGMLHHLEDPDLGLRILSDALTDDGIMAIMVYGYYGRIAIYQMQEVLKLIAPKDGDDATRIAQCKALMRSVHKSHWLTHNNAPFLTELRDQSGAGLYDLFLHTQDRAYTVPQIYDWLAQAGLTVQSFYGRNIGERLYMPSYYTPSKELLESFAKLPLSQQHQVAELLYGHMEQHRFYAVKKPKTVALEDDMVPHFGSEYIPDVNFLQHLLASLVASKTGENVIVEYSNPGLPPVIVTKQPLTQNILSLIDGKRSIADIFAALVEQGILKGSGKKEKQQYMQDLTLLYKDLHGYHRLFLRHKSIPPYILTQEIMQRVQTVTPHATYQGKVL